MEFETGDKSYFRVVAKSCVHFPALLGSPTTYEGLRRPQTQAQIIRENRLEVSVGVENSKACLVDGLWPWSQHPFNW